MLLVKEMPVNAVAELVGEHDTRLWRILKHYVKEARAKADYSGVRKIGIDETSAKLGHDYNLPLWGPGKSQATLCYRRKR